MNSAQKLSDKSETTGFDEGESTRCKLDDNRVNGPKPEKTNDGLLTWLHSLDLACTEALGVCTHKESPLGNLRPLMKILEISCHGIPWILGTLLILLSVHRAEDIEISFNLLLCKYRILNINY